MPGDTSTDADAPVPRWSDRPFPSYAHIPGVTPHPIRDPAGHSYQARLSVAAAPDQGGWRASVDYCAGIDLFNAGYYWEAHEAWEAVWVAVGRHGDIADFLKALIKLAACGVKLREGTPAGARRHLRRARELFEHVSGPQPPPDQCCLGLNPTVLGRKCEQLLAGPLPPPPPCDGRPYPILDIRLLPC